MEIGQRVKRLLFMQDDKTYVNLSHYLKHNSFSPKASNMGNFDGSHYYVNIV